MSPRSRIVGPGSVAGEQRGDAARRLVHGDVERQTLERREHVLLRDRQLVADLRPLVQRAAAARSAPRRAGRASARGDRRVIGRHRTCPASVLRFAASTPMGSDRRPRRPPTSKENPHVRMYGANPDQLASASATTLTQQIEAITRRDVAPSTPRCTRRRGSGPARDRFVERVGRLVQPALKNLNEAFEAAGTTASIAGRAAARWASAADALERRSTSARPAGVVARRHLRGAPTIERCTSSSSRRAVRRGPSRPARRAAVEAAEPPVPTSSSVRSGRRADADAALMPDIVVGHRGSGVRQRGHPRVDARRGRPPATSMRRPAWRDGVDEPG